MALLKNTVIQGQLFVGGPVQASSFIENNVPLVNKYLGITATANAAKTITETLPITKGGTGATTADDAMLAMMNGVGTWTGPVNAERLLAANANGCGTYTLDQLWTDYYQKKFMHGSSSYNCDTQYDTGMYCISNGSNGPSTYGALFVQSYRQHSGNTKPDFAAQIFMPNGDANANEMYFRTSKSNEWDAWQKVATENWVTNKGYITSSSLPTKVSDLTNDSNFISNTANAFSYSNLSDKPTIPTNNNQLDNGAGYITSPDGGNASQLEGSTKQQIIDSARNGLATASSLNNYLPLAGGTMSGQILFSGTDSQQGIMPSANNYGYIGNSTTKWMEIHGVTINADHFTSSSATSATGTNAISLGLSTVASGHYSFALGNSTQATVANTVSFGTNSKATGPNAFAHGNDTFASGRSSHAEGTQCRATKDYAHAEGNTTEALAMNSHAEGVGTKTIAPGQHAEGKYNVENANALLMVGNGARNARSTAFEVLEDGRAKVQSAPTEANDVVRKTELDQKSSSTHTHAVTSTSTSTGGATPGTTGPAGTVNVAGASHTHTVSFTVTTPLASGESVAKFSVSGTTLTIIPVDIQVSGTVKSSTGDTVTVASSNHTHTVNSHTHTYYKADSSTGQPQ